MRTKKFCVPRIFYIKILLIFKPHNLISFLKKKLFIYYTSNKNQLNIYCCENRPKLTDKCSKTNGKKYFFHMNVFIGFLDPNMHYFWPLRLPTLLIHFCSVFFFSTTLDFFQIPNNKIPKSQSLPHIHFIYKI